MQALVILSLFVAANAISTAQQRQYLDASFAKYDHSPKDGDVMEIEWDSTIYRDDANNDTCVTLAEYKQAHSCPVAEDLFKHYDQNHDGCLKVADLSAEFHKIDHNGNNAVSLHEWEQYFLKLVHTLWPHYGHQGR